MTSERTPAPRATREQKQERIKFCVDLMEKHCSKDGRVFTPRMVAKLLAAKFGLSTKSTWRYVSEACKQYQQAAKIPNKARAGWVSDFLEETIANPVVEIRHRLVAAQQYTNLHGLDAPLKTANTTASGEDVSPSNGISQKDRDEFIRLAQQVKSKSCDTSPTSPQINGRLSSLN